METASRQLWLRHRLYHLKDDPSESHDLTASEPARVRALSEKLLRYLEELPRTDAPGRPVEVDSETEESLRALGYIP